MTTHVQWGPDGLRALFTGSAPPEVLVVVDVLRFTTAVSVAVERGATVLPYRWADDGAAAFAANRGAVLADGQPWSLSPLSLQSVPRGTKLVLPSPNGSALAVAAAEEGVGRVLAGCLCNATAAGRAARRVAGTNGVVAVLAAGERGRGGTGPMRVAVEDLLGAGAVAEAAGGEPDAEAEVAIAAFAGCRSRLPAVITNCESGRQLIERGFAADLPISASLDATDVVPVLDGGAFVLLV